MHLRIHDLEGHRTQQRQIFRLEDEAHAALAQQTQHPIVTQPADLIRLLRREEKRILRFAFGRMTWSTILSCWRQCLFPALGMCWPEVLLEGWDERRNESVSR